MKKKPQPSLQELIAVFRELDVHGVGAVLAVDDPDTRRLLAAWESFQPPAWSRPRGRPPSQEDDRTLWAWLWSGMPSAEKYVGGLAMAALVSPNVALVRWRGAIANRLVYPDGTISPPAREAVVRYLDKALGRSRPPAEPSAPRKRIVNHPYSDHGGDGPCAACGEPPEQSSAETTP